MDYFISDLHNMDSNIISYMQRPFTDVYDMRDKMIDMWNSTVEPSDTVYYLGDIGDAEILNELDGNIVFVCGNHDNLDELECEFDDITFYDRPFFLSREIILSHEPIPCLKRKSRAAASGCRPKDSLTAANRFRFRSGQCPKAARS